MSNKKYQWVKASEHKPNSEGSYVCKVNNGFVCSVYFNLKHGWFFNSSYAFQGSVKEWLSEAALKEDDVKPKVVCLCGSTRFAEWFMIKRWELEKQGIITLGINILPNNYFAEGNSHGAEQEGVKDILDELHKRKIDLSDEVYILNVGGYIGESTRNELNYAIEKGKSIRYLEEPLPQPPTRVIEGL